MIGIPLPQVRYRTGYRNTLTGFPKEPLSPFRIILPLLSLAIAFGLSLLVAQSIIAERNFFRVAKQGVGTVIDVKTRTITETKHGKRTTKNVYDSVIQYVDDSGTSRRKTVGGDIGIGNSVQLFYDPFNPSTMKLASGKDNWKVLSWSMGVLLGGWGLISLWNLIRAILTKLRVQRLLSLDHIVTAAVESVKSRVYRRAKYFRVTLFSKMEYERDGTESQLVATWIDPRTGHTYRFFSVGFWGAPLHDVIGKQVEVFVDPENPGNYYFGSEAVSNIV